MYGFPSVMIDEETLAPHTNAAMISLGAVYFDTEVSAHDFYVSISLDSALKYGEVEASTLIWWMQDQQHQARAVFHDPSSVQMDLALVRFKDWFAGFRTRPKDLLIWSNGADFDLPILARLYRVLGYAEAPWKFYNQRCFRTLKSHFHNDVHKKMKDKYAEGEVLHHALSDARIQAKMAIEMLSMLNK